MGLALARVDSEGTPSRRGSRMDLVAPQVHRCGTFCADARCFALGCVNPRTLAVWSVRCPCALCATRGKSRDSRPGARLAGGESKTTLRPGRRCSPPVAPVAHL